MMQIAGILHTKTNKNLFFFALARCNVIFCANHLTGC